MSNYLLSPLSVGAVICFANPKHSSRGGFTYKLQQFHGDHPWQTFRDQLWPQDQILLIMGTQMTPEMFVIFS
jgi:hypothetical protein